ncbi:MAG: Fic family protein [Bacilli bacterium]|nr:Fic family protein [Bacilli bacterium]
MLLFTAVIDYESIHIELEKVISNAKEKEINENNLFDVARFLGDFYYDLIYIHPFRDGNGRCIREYLREFTEYKFPRFSLNYDKIDKKIFY